MGRGMQVMVPRPVVALVGHVEARESAKWTDRVRQLVPQRDVLLAVPLREASPDRQNVVGQ